MSDQQITFKDGRIEDWKAREDMNMALVKVALPVEAGILQFILDEAPYGNHSILPSSLRIYYLESDSAVIERTFFITHTHEPFVCPSNKRLRYWATIQGNNKMAFIFELLEPKPPFEGVVKNIVENVGQKKKGGK